MERLNGVNLNQFSPALTLVHANVPQVDVIQPRFPVMIKPDRRTTHLLSALRARHRFVFPRANLNPVIATISASESLTENTTAIHLPPLFGPSIRYRHAPPAHRTVRISSQCSQTWSRSTIVTPWDASFSMSVLP